MYYIQKDYLGSYYCITDERGEVVVAGGIKQVYSFDPWGRKHNYKDWSYVGAPTSYLFDRGFTGHQHLDVFGLINMNGRIYDPRLARFLSPDNFVQSPNYSQNFNRYSYALNNPLVFTDPDGEFLWIIPNVSWSKEGGVSIGVSAVLGIPGGLSAQAGVGYNFKSKDPYVYAGATYMFNTVYTSYSPSGGLNVGYTAGVSIFSGFPISSNIAQVGVNYNITNNSLSGNISSMYIDQNGATFNPSVTVMVLPEETTNFVRGQGFRSNNGVFDRMMRINPTITCDEMLEYFGFEGEYDPNIKSKNYQSNDYWGATDRETSQISYGKLAFENYSTLYATYIKESYSAKKIQRGLQMKKLPEEFQGLGSNTYLEEIYGYIHAYKNQGLFIGSKLPLKGIKFYQLQLDMYEISYPTYPNHFKWIYKIPRKW